MHFSLVVSNLIGSTGGGAGGKRASDHQEIMAKANKTTHAKQLCSLLGFAFCKRGGRDRGCESSSGGFSFIQNREPLMRTSLACLLMNLKPNMFNNPDENGHYSKNLSNQKRGDSDGMAAIVNHNQIILSCFHNTFSWRHVVVPVTVRVMEACYLRKRRD